MEKESKIDYALVFLIFLIFLLGFANRAFLGGVITPARTSIVDFAKSKYADLNTYLERMNKTATGAKEGEMASDYPLEVFIDETNIQKPMPVRDVLDITLEIINPASKQVDISRIWQEIPVKG